MLRSLAFNAYQDLQRVDSLKVFHDDCLDLSQRVIGYMAVNCGSGTFNKDITFYYETNLLNKLAS
jgi:hypothetical protein